MKEKYEKPFIEAMRVDLNECIASSITVKQGQSLHEILEGSEGNRIWGDDVISLDGEGNRIFN